MNNKHSVPLSLRAIATLWIAVGLYGIAGFALNLLHGKLNIPFISIGVYIGVGLLRLSRSAWQMALTILSAMILFSFVVLATTGPTSFARFVASQVEITLIGGTTISISSIVAWSLFYMVSLSHTWLLLREPIRHLFSEKRDNLGISRPYRRRTFKP